MVDVGVVEERQQRLKTLPTLMELLQLLHHHPLDVGVVEGEVDVAEADDREKRPSQRSEESSHSWLCTVLGLRCPATNKFLKLEVHYFLRVRTAH